MEENQIYFQLLRKNTPLLLSASRPNLFSIVCMYGVCGVWYVCVCGVCVFGVCDMCVLCGMCVVCGVYVM
jgi:hypothetical protein